jgi:class 3 adenylate cyclase
MGSPSSLFVKDPGTSRFVGGGLIEAEALLGSPLPRLPAPEREGAVDVYFVNVHPRLRTLLRRFVQGLLSQIGVASSGRTDAAKDQAEYEAALGRLLRSVRAVDRRQGLLNLFWLAHSRDVAEFLRELETRTPAVKKAKYSLHPLLSSVYRRLDQESRKAPSDGMGMLSAHDNPSIVESVIEDGFAMTELAAADLDFTQFLSANKRYRLSAECFFEIQQVLVRETERRLREGDRGLLSRAARHLPGLPRDQYLKPQSVLKVMMSGPVLTYLLGDAWTTGCRLTASPVLKAEAERRKSSEIVDAFLDVVTGAKRFELLCTVRDRIHLLGSAATERELEDKASRGLRVYEFGESTQVLNNAVNATVLFLDLRGFTQTSEGYISERDLTRELYTVFDEFVPVIRRFGGTVDKYLGDGMMVTWGTDRADPLDALNAVRTAILCQESLRRKREEGSTYFEMGVAIHYGRVYLARFFEDEDAVQSTVIGRNVNLAGRLSSAAKKPIEEDEGEAEDRPAPARASGIGVVVDSGGVLFNEGIAISRDTLGQLETHLALVHGEGVMEYEDEVIDRRILLRYAGDAKFKGVRSSLPVYEVDFEVR